MSILANLLPAMRGSRDERGNDRGHDREDRDFHNRTGHGRRRRRRNTRHGRY
ncbi:hypothetical protein [Kitasatospora sp. NPDC056531]|uniref:hypothetical protein n=1 Tax=Kitasatospora sp. NPDC056531 TaxID=3345856 RepID=UPI0036A3AAE6